MIRTLAASLAFLAARFCLWRSRVWSRRSELMTDLNEWLETPSTWAEIRSHRSGDAG
jgi:hypothetical protein